MKKVRVMLVSALVVAAVGGALAFKAKTVSTGFKCGITTNSCPTTDSRVLTTIGATETNRIASYCTNDGSNNCTFVTLEP